ncbi:MAG: amidohydrolase family protein [Candidatus Omnitrophica bacterium]|nr:amidohydrolase family protein [Candidatus Omnitrophota bacterium]
MEVIDFHTHAFPDNLAERAMKALAEEGNIPYYLDGKVSSLLASMDKAGITKSALCSIATKVNQFASILKWSEEIRTDRIIPFPSLHPDDPDWPQHIRCIKKANFPGIKMHPYYQNFDADEDRLFPLYELIAREKLILVLHTGFDFAFPRIRKADPARIHRILQAVPGLLLVTTHLGAWEDWEEVQRYLLGKPIYMEISFSLEYLGVARSRFLILNHPPEYILFGTDSPWADQAKCLEEFRKLNLPSELEERILGENALALLKKAQ